MKYYDYITDFIFVSQKPEPADVIFIPGSGYGEIAEGAAKLYREGYAKLIIPSGRYAKLKGHFSGVLSPERYLGQNFETESDFLTRILMDQGVPEEAILQEKRATFTYENAIYTWQLLKERNIRIKKAILSCQAYHARRSLMYYQLLFPDVEIKVCPMETRKITRNNWFKDREKMKLVMKEVEHCGSQFALVLDRDADLVDSGDFSCYPKNCENID